MSNSGNIKVYVRCRPMNEKELGRGASSLVRMEGNQTIVSRTSPYASHRRHRLSISEGAMNNSNDDSQQTKAFTFDRSFWSGDAADDHYADQLAVYEELGQELLDHAFDGYNCCIFAYGQTGSGKSYTMMGYGDDTGIIPRASADLFERISHAVASDATLHYQVEVSYLEIYNEKVRDLLNPRNKSNLKVREHPSLGPYVEDLSRLVVDNFEDISRMIQQGNKARTVAATNMNEMSSRSHAVFTIYLTTRQSDDTAKLVTEKVSRISLVDLAGSERVVSSGATGARLKEGANINRSLATLGKVIAALAERSAAQDTKGAKKKPKDYFIPYRDSVLTWLLKDSLGGNSKTAMIATVSPVDYEETLSTLRYADQAKRIRNKPVVNEDPNAKLIRELKEELQALRDALMSFAPDQVERITGSLSSPRILGSKSTPRLSQKAASGASAAASSSLSPPPLPTSTMSSLMPSTPTNSQPASPTTPSKVAITFTDAHGESKALSMKELVDQFKASQKLLDQVNQTWEDKLAKTQVIHTEREKTLEALGILLESSQQTMAIHTPKQVPHLVNLNEDPLMSECLVYPLKMGRTRVGHVQSPMDAIDIRLSGHAIVDEHCYFDHDKDGNVTLVPLAGATVMVNGLRIDEPKQLHNGFRLLLGDYHVFRFNHPEEARRERDQQRLAPMSGRTSQATDRSDSPFFFFSSSDVDTSSVSHSHADMMDWTSAKRDAVLQFSNHHDDPLPLETSSSSRHSVLSVDDRALYASAASYGNNNINNGRHRRRQLSIDTSSLDLKRLYDKDDPMAIQVQQLVDDMQRKMDQQKHAYENKLKRLSSRLQLGSGSPFADKSQHTDNDNDDDDEDEFDELDSGSTMTPLNARERTLAAWAIAQWRQKRYVLMSEQVLLHAVHVKEANIIAKELGKDIVYQFAIIHDNASVTSTSFWEATSQMETQMPTLHQDDPALLHERKPCVGVQVIDKKQRIIYYWSLQNLKQRLEQMRQLYEFSDQPLARRHFSYKDPFHDRPNARFSLIGLASVSLHHLLMQTPLDTSVDVYNTHQCAIVGRLFLKITPIARSIPQQDQWKIKARHRRSYSSRVSIASDTDDELDTSSPPAPAPKQHLIVEIKLTRVWDVPEDRFTQVHAQFRSSSFGHVERGADDDKIYASEPVSGFGAGPVNLQYTQTLAIPITDKTLATLRDGNLTIELFGRAHTEQLYRVIDDALEREMMAAEQDDAPGLHYTSPAPAYTPFVLQPAPKQRRPSLAVAPDHASITEEPEDVGHFHVFPPATPKLPRSKRIKLKAPIRTYTDDGLVVKERHHAVAFVQVCEPDAQGDYVPTSVVANNMADAGCFHLRQGLQRRIKLTMMHDSGLQLPWKHVKNVHIHGIKLMPDDAHHNAHRAPENGPSENKNEDDGVPITILQDHFKYRQDGTCVVVVSGAWDSSLHNSPHLNRLTPQHQRIHLTLSWEIACAKATEPLVFHLNMMLKIHSLNATIATPSMASPSSFLQLLSSYVQPPQHATTSHFRGLFAVHLAPPLTRRVSQLWRINTGNKYVRGEEILGPGRVIRGISLVSDYYEARNRMQWRNSVARTRHRLAILPSPSKIASIDTSSPNDRHQDMLCKVLQLWSAKFGSQDDIVINAHPPLPPPGSPLSTISVSSMTSMFNKKGTTPLKLAPRITHHWLSDTIAKKGYLGHPDMDDKDKWHKRWVVLRR
ncbi:hypothetical protein BC940DRAFT_297840 [Gongronella butleri]|nr:hypothetical protein BC940DRAFT_297840 [Gongronella butleri]